MTGTEPGGRFPGFDVQGQAPHWDRVTADLIEASRPIPPTMVTSSGASSGGPISML